MLIDVDKVSHILVAEVLSDKDIEIVHVQNGKDAINLFRHNPFFDLVIIELMLPDMDGFSVLKEIRKANPIVPVIAQTAEVRYNIENRCLREGFNYFIEKPTTLELFVDKVEKYIHYIHI
jgi:two-component system cell cycle response regulator DivK